MHTQEPPVQPQLGSLNITRGKQQPAVVTDKLKLKAVVKLHRLDMTSVQDVAPKKMKHRLHVLRHMIVTADPVQLFTAIPVLPFFL